MSCVGHSMRRAYAPQTEALTPESPLAPVPSDILDQFVGQGPISPEELHAAVRRFKKAIIDRALGGALTHHLRLPAGWHETRGDDESPQRDRRQDGPHGRRPAPDRCAGRSRLHF
jgi:hypothetical protein